MKLSCSKSEVSVVKIPNGSIDDNDESTALYSIQRETVWQEKQLAELTCAVGKKSTI